MMSQHQAGMSEQHAIVNQHGGQDESAMGRDMSARGRHESIPAADKLAKGSNLGSFVITSYDWP